MDLLLSIKPQFVEKIIEGKKTIEYRKKIFIKQDIERIYIYSSKPIQKIIGYFLYDGYILDSPEKLWSMTRSISGITEEYFFRYYINTTIAYGIKIKDLKIFNNYIDPYQIIKNFNPPQSYQYLERGYFD